MSDYIEAGAVISDDQNYRYLLTRAWDMHNDRRLAFIMLNPSTADGSADDPTIRRCVGFAKALDFGRLMVVNLFAFRTAQPAILWNERIAGRDIVGPANQHYLRKVADEAEQIICAWGADQNIRGGDERAMGWISDRDLYTLGTTLLGAPAHPLYLPASARPLIYRLAQGGRR